MGQKLGQHWLDDIEILEKIAQYGSITDKDNVIEVGPGKGYLTEVLLDYSNNLTAIEYDKTLVPELNQKFASTSLKIVNQDIIEFKELDLPPNYKIIANIPYYLTSKLIKKFLTSDNKPELMVLLIQKDVALRLAAKPGKLSILAISAQLYADIELGVEVGPEKFSPPPKVMSQVVILKTRQQPLFEDIDEDVFFKLVKAGFSNKRKTLLNSLSASLPLDKNLTQKLLVDCSVSPALRAQALTLEQWHLLHKQYQTLQG